VLHLCQQVANDLQPHELLAADVFLEELQALAGDWNPQTRMLGQLNEESIQHIIAHGRYKTIKTWAQQQMAKVATSSEIDDTRRMQQPQMGAPPQGAWSQQLGGPVPQPGYGYGGLPTAAGQQMQAGYGQPGQAPNARDFGPSVTYAPQPGGPQVLTPGYNQPMGRGSYVHPDHLVGPNADPYAPSYSGPAGFSNTQLPGAGVVPTGSQLLGPDGQPIG
jgi:hypothetical protein